MKKEAHHKKITFFGFLTNSSEAWHQPNRLDVCIYNYTYLPLARVSGIHYSIMSYHVNMKTFLLWYCAGNVIYSYPKLFARAVL